MVKLVKRRLNERINNPITSRTTQMAEFEFKCSKCGLVFKDTYDYPLPTDCNAAVRCPKCKGIARIINKNKFKLINESINKRVFHKGDKVEVNTLPYGRITGTVVGVSKSQSPDKLYTAYDVRWDRDPTKIGWVEDYNMTLISESTELDK